MTIGPDLPGRLLLMQRITDAPMVQLIDAAAIASQIGGAPIGWRWPPSSPWGGAVYFARTSPDSDIVKIGRSWSPGWRIYTQYLYCELIVAGGYFEHEHALHDLFRPEQINEGGREFFRGVRVESFIALSRERGSRFGEHERAGTIVEMEQRLRRRLVKLAERAA